MSQKKRNIISTIVFLIILFLVLTYVNKVFDINDIESSSEFMKGIYTEKEDSLDGMYFGSSGVNRYWMAPMAYHDEGIAVSSISTAMQPLAMEKFLIKEALKRQKPKVIILELRTTRKSANNTKESEARRILDNMKFSPNKVEAIDYILNWSKKGDNPMGQNKLYYYFPISKYHNRWNDDIGTSDLVDFNKENQFKGYYEDKMMFNTEPLVLSEYTINTLPLAEEMDSALNDLLDYFDTLKDTEVLFVCSPFNPSVFNQSRMNTAIQLVEKRDYKVLNFNTPEMREKLELDYSTDFYDINHVNYKGAIKYTKWLEKYLVDNYDLPNHKNDPGYSDWNESYEKLTNFIKSKGKTTTKQWV